MRQKIQKKITASQLLTTIEEWEHRLGNNPEQIKTKFKKGVERQFEEIKKQKKNKPRRSLAEKWQKAIQDLHEDGDIDEFYED